MDRSAFVDRTEWVYINHATWTGKRVDAPRLIRLSGTSNNASPFWRSSSANSQREKSNATPERKVFGASYSHADVLKLDELSVAGGDSRPRTPPALPRNKGTPPPRSAPNASTTIPAAYPAAYWSRDDDWNATASDHPDLDDPLADSEDEDEFGLPSLASMRRKDKRLAQKRAQTSSSSTTTTTTAAAAATNTSLYPPNGSSFAGTTSTASPLTGRTLSAWALDNGDVAEERVIPSYPSAKQSDGKMLRPQYKDILRDPANSLHLISHPPVPQGASAKELEAHSARITRINKFKRILQASSINLPELRDSAWSGLPPEVRAMSWQLLLGYLPASSDRRVATLERKRREYLDGIRQTFDRPAAPASAAGHGSASRAPRGLDEAIWHQIAIDVPRTNPHLALYAYDATQRSLERILYLWAIRHPASGYVQGINDLATPFYQVFLAQYITSPDVEAGLDPGMLPKAVLEAVEADTFWCLTKLLEGIQDNYIHAQPGILRMVGGLRDLVARIDHQLARHLDGEGVEFIQFSFRWMNCLLMREVSVRNTIRMWDTYLAEDRGFSLFHLYVCAAFLVKWSAKLQKMDFQEIMMFLQSLPTKDWTEKDVELLLSEAFIWKSLFEGAKAHVSKTSGGVLG